MSECQTPTSPGKYYSSTDSWIENRGGQRRRFKDTANHYTKKSHISINTWEDMAADPLLCRRSIHQAAARFETDHLHHEAEKLQRRKEREMSQHLHIFLPPRTSCPHYNTICKSRIATNPCQTSSSFLGTADDRAVCRRRYRG